jgi:hypothetical protein
MLHIAPELQAQFEEHLAKRLIPNGLHGVCKKWPRYYLDFCHKYRFPPTYTQSLPRLTQDMQEKKQRNKQQEQAANATEYYYGIREAKSPLDF